MTESEKMNVTDIATEKLEILKDVNAVGSLEKMSSWEKAFPHINFPEKVYSKIIDEALYEDTPGKHEMFAVKWDERTVEEKLFFVLYQEHCGELEVKYDVEVADELKMTQTVDEPEIIWYMWIDGCFTGEELNEEALRDFVGLLTDKHLDKRSYIDEADIAEIRVENIKVAVKG
jgi:hypothetical protein